MNKKRVYRTTKISQQDRDETYYAFTLLPILDKMLLLYSIKYSDVTSSIAKDIGISLNEARRRVILIKYNLKRLGGGCDL